MSFTSETFSDNSEGESNSGASQKLRSNDDTPLTVSFIVKSLPDKRDLYDIQKIFSAIASYYAFKNIEDSRAHISKDTVERTYEVTLTTGARVPKRLFDKINTSIGDFSFFLGYVLLSRNVLATITDAVEGKIPTIYNSWGVIARREDIADNPTTVMETLLMIENQTEGLSSMYVCFISTPSVVKVADRYNLFYKNYNEYIILRRMNYSMDRLSMMIADELVS